MDLAVSDVQRYPARVDAGIARWTQGTWAVTSERNLARIWTGSDGGRFLFIDQ